MRPIDTSAMGDVFVHAPSQVQSQCLKFRLVTQTGIQVFDQSQTNPSLKLWLLSISFIFNYDFEPGEHDNQAGSCES